MAGDAAKIALEASGVRKIYTKNGREMPVLDVGSFAAREGEFITIIGPSGCGKSTFLHIMGGFIAADAGTIRVYGNAVNGPGPDRGMMFQEFALFPWKTVAGNVAWGLEAQGFERQKIDETVKPLPRHHGPRRIPQPLSRRDLRRHEAARRPRSRARLRSQGPADGRALRRPRRADARDHAGGSPRIWERTRKTIVFVTHDIEEAVFLGDRVVVLSARPGRIREDIRINLPRPRTLEIKKSVQCHEYRNTIWDLVRRESRA